MALQEEFEKQGNWLFKYRGSIPVIPLIIAAGLYVYTKFYPETCILTEAPYKIWYEYLCLIVSLFGLGIRIYTVGHTPDNTSGRNTEEQVADVLNTTGIYSTVRHPLYLGNFFMWLGPALLTANFWFVIAFCFFYWVYYERIMFAEEQFLRRKFGNTYTDWAGRLPAFLPSFKNFVKPNSQMSWGKVFKNEKNGLAAVFFIFAAFNIAGELVQHRTDFNYFFIIGSILSVLLYLIMKYIIK